MKALRNGWKYEQVACGEIRDWGGKVFEFPDASGISKSSVWIIKNEIKVTYS